MVAKICPLKFRPVVSVRKVLLVLRIRELFKEAVVVNRPEPSLVISKPVG